MVTKRTLLKKFKKNQNKLAELDANYLVGKLKRPIYLKRRNLLRKEFESLKKRYRKEV
ncbi:MAG: hypothetical protein Q8P20_07915 [bacterium]|nr:hypothetical protein [bacterium]